MSYENGVKRVKNVSAGKIIESFDGRQVEFEAGEEKILLQNVAQHIVNINENLQFVEDLSDLEAKVKSIIDKRPEIEIMHKETNEISKEEEIKAKRLESLAKAREVKKAKDESK